MMENLFGLCVRWEESLHFLPVCSRMIVIFGVSEFMNDDVAQERWREEEQDGVEHNGAAARAAAPL